jgi:predicted hydrocarbon binding protein
MSYLLKLDEPSSYKLLELAEKERLSASKLIERIVTGYLNSISKEPDFDYGVNKRLGLSVAGLKSLYHWDEEKGTISFTPANRRVFVMSASAWDSVEQGLFLGLLDGAVPLLSAMGNAFGRVLALDYKSVTGEPENIKSYFEYLSLAAGWGKFKTSGDLEHGSKITIRVRDCVFCTSRNASLGRKDPCCFLMGVCKGIADTVFDSSHYVYETKCCAKGNGFCEITMGRETESDAGRNSIEWAVLH